MGCLYTTSENQGEDADGLISIDIDEPFTIDTFFEELKALDGFAVLGSEPEIWYEPLISEKHFNTTLGQVVLSVTFEGFGSEPGYSICLSDRAFFHRIVSVLKESKYFKEKEINKT